MQNSTPSVKAETRCSIYQQTKVLCKKLVLSVTYLIAVSRPHYLPVYVRVCKLLSGKRTERTHIALRTVVAVQHSDSEYSNNTFTITTGDDIGRRPTGKPQHSIQFPILTAVPQFGCTGTDSLLQSARFTV